MFSIKLIEFFAGFVEEDSPYSSDNQKGTYYFEFSRPLRTSDRLQQVRKPSDAHIFRQCTLDS